MFCSRPKAAFSANSKLELNKINDDFFPCFIKPINNCASRGVIRITNKTDLINSFDEVSSNNYGEKTVLVEKEIIKIFIFFSKPW